MANSKIGGFMWVCGVLKFGADAPQNKNMPLVEYPVVL